MREVPLLASSTLARMQNALASSSPVGKQNALARSSKQAAPNTPEQVPPSALPAETIAGW